MNKTINKIKLIAMLLSLVFVMAGTNAAFASEVTGTLSTDSSQTKVGSPTGTVVAGPTATVGGNPSALPLSQGGSNFLSGVPWNGELAIKTVLVSLLVLEILVLAVLNFRSRKKKNAYT